jgi:hypothetical protein
MKGKEKIESEARSASEGLLNEEINMLNLADLGSQPCASDKLFATDKRSLQYHAFY